jgi:tape measure domain-containing protein
MNALGNAVAGVWWSQETLNGVIVALGQMQTKGKLVQQEVNQIAERGIPIFEILRQKLWLTQAQLADIGNQNISSAKAIPLILEWINEKFWWLMEQQAKTLQGRLSNLIDTFKIGLASFGEVIAPLFVWIISTLQTLLTPAFNILILWVKGLAVVFRTVFDGMKQIYQFFANNFVIITRVILASFLSALIIMRQQTIITFLQGVVQNFIKGMTTMITSVVAFWRASLNFILNLRQITIEAVRATVAFVRKSVALAINTARTYAQIIANNLASFSFRALGLSILGTIKNLILLGCEILSHCKYCHRSSCRHFYQPKYTQRKTQTCLWFYGKGLTSSSWSNSKSMELCRRCDILSNQRNTQIRKGSRRFFEKYLQCRYWYR